MKTSPAGDHSEYPLEINNKRSGTELKIADLKTSRLVFKKLPKTPSIKSNKEIVITALDGKQATPVVIKVKETFKKVFPQNKKFSEFQMKKDVEHYLEGKGFLSDKQSNALDAAYSLWKAEIKEKFKGSKGDIYKTLKDVINSVENTFFYGFSSYEALEPRRASLTIRRKSMETKNPEAARELMKLEKGLKIATELFRNKKELISPSSLRQVMGAVLNPEVLSEPLNVFGVVLTHFAQNDEWQIDVPNQLIGESIYFDEFNEVVVVPIISAYTIDRIKSIYQELQISSPGKTRFSRVSFSLPATIEKAPSGFVLIPRGREKQVLGAGGYCKVKLGFFIPDKESRAQPVAVSSKTIRVKKELKATYLDEQRKRIEELKPLNSKYTLAAPVHITDPHRSSKHLSSKEKQASIFEAFDSSSDDYISGVVGSSGKKRWNGYPEEILKIVHSVAKAVQFVHSKGYVHADIKPENILVRADKKGGLNQAVLADFDGCFKIGTKSAITATPGFFIDEEVKKTGFTQNTDLYALGVTIKELISKCGELNTNLALLNLIKGLTDPAPANRPSIARVLALIESVSKEFKLDLSAF